MKIVVIIALIIILAAGSGIFGFLFAHQSQSLNDAQSQIALLKADIASLQGDVKVLQSSVTQTVAATGQSAQAAAPAGNAVVALIPVMTPVMVRIDVAGPGFKAAGSGFLIDARGYVMTNQHVIEQAADMYKRM
jgi:S1-C subfamily serine protease